jgi:hypothetical protein
MEIKYSKEKPPVYEQCAKQFNVNWDMGIIITYGDVIHCKVPIQEDMLVHEATHVKQQLAMGKEKWWKKYFKDEKFRLSQEVEAYRNQLDFITQTYSRKYRKFLKKHIVNCMVNLYGGMCTEEEAIKLLS